ncbi:MAG: hypothetical protein V4636_21230, partial [Pseudomonadota bacterium]
MMVVAGWRVATVMDRVDGVLCAAKSRRRPQAGGHSRSRVRRRRDHARSGPKESVASEFLPDIDKARQPPDDHQHHGQQDHRV